MYAISFDMNTSSLQDTYTTAYNNAYYEIQNILKFWFRENTRKCLCKQYAK